MYLLHTMHFQKRGLTEYKTTSKRRARRGCPAPAFPAMRRRPASSSGHLYGSGFGQRRRRLLSVGYHAVRGKPEHDLRAFVGLAFNRQAAAVQLRELARKRQSKPYPREPLRKTVIHLPEVLERPFDLLSGHADTAVRDSNAEPAAILQLGVDQNAAARLA